MTWNTNLEAAPNMDDILVLRRAHPNMPLLGWHHTGTWFVDNVRNGELMDPCTATEVTDVVAWMPIPVLDDNPPCR